MAAAQKKAKGDAKTVLDTIASYKENIESLKEQST